MADLDGDPGTTLARKIRQAQLAHYNFQLGKGGADPRDPPWSPPGAPREWLHTPTPILGPSLGNPLGPPSTALRPPQESAKTPPETPRDSWSSLPPWDPPEIHSGTPQGPSETPTRPGPHLNPPGLPWDPPQTLLGPAGPPVSPRAGGAVLGGCLRRPGVARTPSPPRRPCPRSGGAAGAGARHRQRPDPREPAARGAGAAPAAAAAAGAARRPRPRRRAALLTPPDPSRGSPVPPPGPPTQ